MTNETELRAAARKVLYEAERVYTQQDPTSAHCFCCHAAVPSQGEPPAHEEWCGVARLRAVLGDAS